MKKILLALAAMLTLVFTGCKVENSKITVSVEDTAGNPVANRSVFYADYASIIIGAALPSPEQLITDIEDCWEYAETNAQGTVTLTIPLGVSKIKYRFIVYDAGSNEWKYEDREIRRGVNDEIKFVVNK